MDTQASSGPLSVRRGDRMARTDVDAWSAAGRKRREPGPTVSSWPSQLILGRENARVEPSVVPDNTGTLIAVTMAAYSTTVPKRYPHGDDPKPSGKRADRASSANNEEYGAGMTPEQHGTEAPGEQEAAPSSIVVCPDGPLIVRGDFAILTPSGGAVPRDRKTVALSRCGASAIKPYCDGTHKLIRVPHRTPCRIAPRPGHAGTVGGRRRPLAVTVDNNSSVSAHGVNVSI
jgi:CDGSH-type Zn-finger protein